MFELLLILVTFYWSSFEAKFSNFGLNILTSIVRKQFILFINERIILLFYPQAIFIGRIIPNFHWVLPSGNQFILNMSTFLDIRPKQLWAHVKMVSRSCCKIHFTLTKSIWFTSWGLFMELSIIIYPDGWNYPQFQHISLSRGAIVMTQVEVVA